MYLYCHLDTIAHSCSLMKAKKPKPVSHSLLRCEVIQDYNDLLLTLYKSNSHKGSFPRASGSSHRVGLNHGAHLRPFGCLYILVMHLTHSL